MRVVHLSTTDYGGAYKAAQRISKSMQICGIDSCVCVRTKTIENEKNYAFLNNPLSILLSKTKNFLNLLMSKKDIQSDYFGTNIMDYSLIKEADIVILHWVNSFISYQGVKKLLSSKKKVIWVLHDMWLFTGGCHCDQYCGNYKNGCGECILIKSKRKKDITFYNFRQKKKMMQQSNITIVGPSNWIVKEGNKSEILLGKRILCIPNPIDVSVFRVIENVNQIKNKYGIKNDKKVILFGAINSLGNSNKGYNFLKESLKQLEKQKYMAVVYGNQEEDLEIAKYIDIVFLGMIKEEEDLAEIYNIADVFVAPSKQENYSNSVLEALACGTPVTAFCIGGMPDLIKHKKNGYLAKCWKVDELTQGIQFCVENRRVLGKKARESVENRNTYDLVGRRYKELCESI